MNNRTRNPTNGFRQHAMHHFGRCQWCNTVLTWDESTVDHITALSCGGHKTAWDNLCISCPQCNVDKGSDDWGRPRYGPDPWKRSSPRRERVLPKAKPRTWEASLTYQPFNFPLDEESHERAAIMEFDGGLSREDAEFLAVNDF